MKSLPAQPRPDPVAGADGRQTRIPGEPASGIPPILTPPDRPRATTSRSVLWLPLALIAFALTLLHLFPPQDHIFYPKCGLYQFTGWHCPGCGSLRALHHLTHGRIVAAAHANALLVGALTAYTAWALLRLCQGGRLPLPWSELSGRWFWIVMTVVFGFGLLRNLPFPPFSWMAPP